MRICIFSHPRSGSSLLQQFYAEKYNLTNYDELFDIDYFDENKYQLLNEENYIVKIMAFDFLKYDFQKINWKNFDKILITERKDLFEACASNYVAEFISDFDKKKININFEISKQFLVKWIKFQKMFYQYKNKILQTYNCQQFYYEDIIIHDEISNYRNFKKSIYNYKNTCLNYKKIDKKLKKYFQIIN